MSDCVHKTPFTSRDTARRFADHLARETGRAHGVRECRQCRALIVGPTPDREQMRKIARRRRAQ